MHVVNNVIMELLIWRRGDSMQQKRVNKRPSKEMKFFHRRLCMCDVEVMVAFVVKFIDECELHVAVYPTSCGSSSSVKASYHPS